MRTSNLGGALVALLLGAAGCTQILGIQDLPPESDAGAGGREDGGDGGRGGFAGTGGTIGTGGSSGSGGSMGSGGASGSGGSIGSGGSLGIGGTVGIGGSLGIGGSSTGGSIGTGGSSTGGFTGGFGTGGSSTGGFTGGFGTGGSIGTGGSLGIGGSPGIGGGFGQPACGNTMEGTAIGKGVACQVTDTQFCYKPCVVDEAMGVKSETCTTGAYAEQMTCTYDPSQNYACYRVPMAGTQDSRCPATAPMSSSTCSIPDCVVCGGTTGYQDTSGNQKTGYCVCDSGGKWSCTTTAFWPCPSSVGC